MASAIGSHDVRQIGLNAVTALDMPNRQTNVIGRIFSALSTTGRKRRCESCRHFVDVAPRIDTIEDRAFNEPPTEA
jgi:hypothetical protein